MQTYGVNLSAGTLTDGLKRFVPLFEAIYVGIITESRRGILWSADETRWMVFVQIEKKVGYRWYLWAFQSATAIAFELDPSRSHRVPDSHFQGVEGGILLVDRYAGYKAMQLVKEGTILLAFCWAHVRRDFVRVGKSWPKLIPWALEWLLEIRELYHLNRQRLLCRDDPAAFAIEDRKVRDALGTCRRKSKQSCAPRFAVNRKSTTLRDRSLARCGGPFSSRVLSRSPIQAFAAWYCVALRADTPPNSP